MKTKEEIDKTYLQVCKDCGSKEIASEYCGFIKGYTQCQEDMAKEIEELKDWKRWFFEEQKRADDLRMELEYIKLTTKNK
jgi:hypothetical protein